MTKTAKFEGPLTEAAAAFERELGHYERLSIELQKSPVRSDKTLQRVKKLLNDASAHDAELGSLLEGLSRAMIGARDRQQACMQRIADAVTHAQLRADEFTALLERVSALGAKAQEVHEPVGRVLAEKQAGGNPAAMIASLGEVEAKIQAVVEDAQRVLEDAERGDFPELAKDVRSLQQQVQFVRGKVKQAYLDVAGAAQVTIVDPQAN